MDQAKADLDMAVRAAQPKEAEKEGKVKDVLIVGGPLRPRVSPSPEMP